MTMGILPRSTPTLPGHFRFVPGYPDFPYDLVNEAVRTARPGDILCEVGAFLGHGTCHIMECIQRYHAAANPPVYLYAFDLFGETPEAKYGEGRDGQLMPWGEAFESWATRSGGRSAVVDAFQFYTSQSPARQYLYDWIQVPPAHGGDDFRDESISFVLLHQSQRPENVANDIHGWWRTVKPGGQLAVVADCAEQVLRASIEAPVGVLAQHGAKVWSVTKPSLS